MKHKITHYILEITLIQSLDFCDDFDEIIKLYEKDPELFNRAKKIVIGWD